VLPKAAPQVLRLATLSAAALSVFGSPLAAQCIGASTASWPRKHSARARLLIDWQTPHVVSLEADQRPKSERELSVDAVLKKLRGRDPRPLLVFRDHRGIKDRKLASLIDRLLKSERFRLASRWFHCIRLPRDANQPGHTFAKLFGGTRAAHLLLLSTSGKKRVKLLQTSKAKASWSVVASVLREDYSQDPTTRIREYQMLLNQFDACDSRIAELEERIEGLRERAVTHEVDARKVRRLEARLADAFREREQLVKLECKVSDLGLGKGEGALPMRRRRHDRRRPR